MNILMPIILWQPINVGILIIKYARSLANKSSKNPTIINWHNSPYNNNRYHKELKARNVLNASIRDEKGYKE
jgi:hypothetical protein